MGPGQRPGDNVGDVQKVRVVSQASDHARHAANEIEYLLPQFGIASGSRIREWRFGVFLSSVPLLATLRRGCFDVLG